MKNKMKQQHHFSTTWKHVILKKEQLALKTYAFHKSVKAGIYESHIKGEKYFYTLPLTHPP